MPSNAMMSRKTRLITTVIAIILIGLLIGGLIPARTLSANQPGTTFTLWAATSTVEGTPTPEPTTIAPVTMNSQWHPVIAPINGIDMVLVPPGCFNMGSTNGYADELPVTHLCFDKPFWIDKTEVSNAQFQQFNGQASNFSYWLADDLPRTNLMWFEAREFCKLRGARLPTEAEWEYAARGPDNLIYPWGNVFDASRVVNGPGVVTQVAPVGSIPGGASWVGALDMSGNVWEWTGSIYMPYPYVPGDGREVDSNNNVLRVVRGGAWNSQDQDHLRAPDRNWNGPVVVFWSYGVRCAKSL